VEEEDDDDECLRLEVRGGGAKVVIVGVLSSEEGVSSADTTMGASIAEVSVSETTTATTDMSSVGASSFWDKDVVRFGGVGGGGLEGKEASSRPVRDTAVMTAVNSAALVEIIDWTDAFVVKESGNDVMATATEVSSEGEMVSTSLTALVNDSTSGMRAISTWGIWKGPRVGLPG